MKKFNWRGEVKKFPGTGGWIYVSVPKKYTKVLQQKRQEWGMYPITAEVKQSKWPTKLMLQKGGDFFVALKAAIRKKEDIMVGDRIQVSVTLV